MILPPQLTSQAQLDKALGENDAAFLLTAAWLSPGGKETGSSSRGEKRRGFSPGHCLEWRRCLCTVAFCTVQTSNSQPCGPTPGWPCQGDKGTGEMLLWMQFVVSAQVPGPTWLKETTNC